MKILLVEPDAILSRTYKKALEAVGHEVRTTASGQRAINLIDEDLPDAVLLEIQLVGHSGIEFLHELRSYNEWQKLPVIILSNVPPQEFAGSKNTLKQYLGIGKYFYKPATTINQILAAIDSLKPAVT